MICNKIQFSKYRNIESSEVIFDNGINVLWGNNAQGKSNILEGIYYFARGKSFRGAKDKELIKFGEDFAKFQMNFIKDDAKYETKLEVLIPSLGKKTITRGGAKITPSEMIGDFKAVLFAPSHLTLVSGSPSLRRAYLDIALSQLFPSYLSLLLRYTKVLDERNALLKSAADGIQVSHDEWQVYAEQLAYYGVGISSLRELYINNLQKHSQDYFDEMTSGKEKPTFSYSSHLINDDNKNASLLNEFSKPVFDKEKQSILYDLLMKDIDREIHAKSTLWGIHKDDIAIKLCDSEARQFASQGQQRSIALAMKLAEGEIAHSITKEYPVFLLDDVLSELDNERRTYILGSLKNRQIIVTSCEPSLFDKSNDRVTMIKVTNGQVERL